MDVIEVIQDNPVIVIETDPSPVVLDVLAGAQGIQGLKGDKGDAATIAVGTVTTSAPGTTATITNAGDSGDAVFNFTIPRGDKGEQGIQGIQGVQGIQGEAATIAVGAVTTGAPGTSASIVNAGTTGDAIFNFAIPRGDTGAQGPQGIQGPQGVQGETGPANSLTVGTVSSTDTAPQVTITGASPNQVINFVLQRGPQGIQGPQGEQGLPGEGSVNSVNGDPGPEIVLDYTDVGAEPTITAGTISQYWRGNKTWATLNKAAVGLSNVDNTSDTNKPISTATQTALNSKADLVGGFVPTSQLPPLAINEIFTVASQAAMLALTAQRGDMAIRTDNGKTYVLSSDSPGTLADWKEIMATGQVVSVAGKTGTVTLDAADITSGTFVLARLPVAASGASSATQLVRADDSRLSNARTPTAHVHAAADINSGTLDIARIPVAASGTSSATQVVRADDSRLSNARTPTAHAHAAADVSSGTLDIARLPVATSGTSNTTQVVRADDARLSNARTPTAHTHTKAQITDFAHTHAAGDITSGVISTSRLGTGTANITTYLRGDGTWALIETTGTVPIQTTEPVGEDEGTFWYDSDEVFDGYANVTRVLHNGTAYPARPSGATYVEWVGPVAPTSQITGDTWVNTA